MIRRSLFLAIPLCLAALQVSAQDEKPVTVTFKKKLRQTGDRFKRQTFTKLVMSSTQNTDDGEVDEVYLKSLEYMTRNTEVLARNKDHVTKLRTHCLKHSKTENRGEAKTKKSLVAGKTLVIEKKAKGISVRDEKGKEVSEELKLFTLEKFTGDFYDFETSFFSALNKGQAIVGKAFNVDAKIANEMFHDDDPDPAAFKVKTMILTLKSVDDKGLARFAADITFVSLTKEEETTRLLLKGTVDVETSTCQLRKFDLKGQVKFLGDSANKAVTSRGVVEFKEVVKLLPRKVRKAPGK